jgi:hypothetical protein
VKEISYSQKSCLSCFGQWEYTLNTEVIILKTLLISILLFNIKAKKVTLSLSLANWALRHEGVWGSGSIDPRFLDLGISWIWVVSFTPLLLYPRGKSSRYPLDRRLGVPQSQYGRYGESKILDPTGTRTLTPRSSRPYTAAILTALSRFILLFNILY